MASENTPTTRQLIAIATYRQATDTVVKNVKDIDLFRIEDKLTRATVRRLITNEWDGRSELKL